jgi:TetR/AcrR family transcriptional regulator, tetracycline repressor protein
LAKERVLSRRRILEAALELADGEGLGAVSMRRVARRVGAGTMSLYHHVPDKEALLGGLADLVFERVGLPEESGSDWADRVVGLNLAFRRAALEHPAVVPVIASGLVGGLWVEAPPFEGVEEHLRYAQHRQAAAHAYRATTSYAVGYLSLELGGFFGSVVGDHRRDGPGRPSPEQYPRLAGVAPHLRAWDPEYEFEAGLRRLLTGLHEDLVGGSGR